MSSDSVQIQLKNKQGLQYALVAAGLFISSALRSGLVTDGSFFPRFAALTLCLVLLLPWLFRNRHLLQNDWLFLALTGFSAWNAISAAWSTVPSEALQQACLFFCGAMVYLLIKTWLSKDSGNELFLLKTYLVLTIFSFIPALIKLFSLPFFDPYQLSGICANNNLYSGFLLLSLPLSIRASLLHKGAWRYISLLTLVASLFFLFILQTRAAYLALITAGLLFLLFFFVPRPVTHAEISMAPHRLAGIIKHAGNRLLFFT